MFLKIDNDKVTIKGQECVDGRKQRTWLSNKHTNSPTVFTEDLMLSCMIDIMEGHDVATDDIPGAFLKTDYNEGDIYIKMEVVMVTTLEEINLYY